jgi:hypothetical protein
VESVEKSVFVELFNGRMNQKGQTSLAALVLFLHKLVVPWASPEFHREDFFKKLKQITIEIIHALASKLFEAPDVVKMQ